jgi:hypothetical protein
MHADRTAGGAQRHRAVDRRDGRLIRAEEPCLVPVDRSAERKARLVAVVLVVGVRDVLGLVLIGQADAQRPRAGVRAVGRAEGGRLAAGGLVPLPVEQPVAMPVVGAALRDRVDDAAGGATIFRGVAARFHLHFVDEVHDHVLAREAALEIRRLDAVDDVAVLAGARAIDREAAKLPFVIRARRLAHERREVAAVRNQRDLLGTDVRLPRRLLDVNQR